MTIFFIKKSASHHEQQLIKYLYTYDDSDNREHYKFQSVNAHHGIPVTSYDVESSLIGLLCGADIVAGYMHL